MADLENTPEVVDTTELAPAEVFAEDTLLPNTNDVKDAIQKARAQEKAKLYPQMEKLQEELSLLRKEREDRQALEAERNAKRQQREAEREAEKKARPKTRCHSRNFLKLKKKSGHQN
jgi:hypothetical protein